MRNKCVIAAYSQISNNPKYDLAWTSQDPAHLMAQACKKLISSDPRLTKLNNTVDAVGCVEPFSWSYQDLNLKVLDMANLSNSCEKIWEPAGGNSPSDLIHRITESISLGIINSAIIVGGESAYSRAIAKKKGDYVDWDPRPKGYNPLRNQPEFSSRLEQLHGLTLPAQSFAMYDNALRAERKIELNQWRYLQSKLLLNNSYTASNNPYAWNKTPLTIQDIATESENNRMVSYPYTKYMMAFPFVDQSAALLLLSDAEAIRLGFGVDEVQTIIAGVGADDSSHMLDRETYTSSPALVFIIQEVLKMASIKIDEIEIFDLYSCFPSAMRIALETLNIDENDSRPMTATGGLAYAGGPGNSYCLHAFAAMSDLLKKRKYKTGMITGVGMSFSKHSATVISNDEKIIQKAACTAIKKYPLSKETLIKPSESGRFGVIETYTIDYDKKGRPTQAIVIVDLKNGFRTIANNSSQDQIVELLKKEPIGRKIELIKSKEGNNLIYSFIS